MANVTQDPDPRPCLPRDKAIDLVVRCSGLPDDLPLSTRLGPFFAAPTKRTQFCQCVADGVPIDRSEIPCGEDNSFQDVVDAISC